MPLDPPPKKGFYKKKEVKLSFDFQHQGFTPEVNGVTYSGMTDLFTQKKSEPRIFESSSIDLQI